MSSNDFLRLSESERVLPAGHPASESELTGSVVIIIKRVYFPLSLSLPKRARARARAVGLRVENIDGDLISSLN